MEKETKELIDSVRLLTIENKKLSSLKYNFFRGIVFGIGSAIGASVIAAIVIGIAAKFFESLRNINF